MKIRTILLLMNVFMTWVCVVGAEQASLPSPGNYPSDYTLCGYPVVFEDETLTGQEKEFILDDHKVVWEGNPPLSLDRVFSTNEARIISLPNGKDVRFYGKMYTESGSIGPDQYREEVLNIGYINDFGYVWPVTKILSDAYRTVRQLPDFEVAYAKLGNYFYTMNHLTESSFTKIGDIIAVYGDPTEEDIAEINIRYFIEASQGAQYRSTSVLNFAIGEGDLARQLTSYMEMRKEGSAYSTQWTACPIVYNNERWKMYIPPEWK